MNPPERYPDLITPIIDRMQRTYGARPCTTNRASTLGDDCERRLVYARTRWSEAAPPDLGLLQIWHQGVVTEEAIVDELRRAGVPVIQQQLALEWREYQITGHIDFAIECDGQLLPVDVKSMAPHLWRAIFRRGQGQYSWDEIAEAISRKPWQRHYRAQITLYDLMMNVSRGVLLCVDKSSGEIGQINVGVDYAYAETLLLRAERLNDHVAHGTLPERIAIDDDVCGRCLYRHVCLPDYVERGVAITRCDDAEVLSWLERMAEIEAAAEEYEGFMKRARAWALAREGDVVAVGRWRGRKRKSGRGMSVVWEIAD